MRLSCVGIPGMNESCEFVWSCFREIRKGFLLRYDKWTRGGHTEEKVNGDPKAQCRNMYYNIPRDCLMWSLAIARLNATSLSPTLDILAPPLYDF